LTTSELSEVAKFKESQVPTDQIFTTLNDKNKANMTDRYNVLKLLGIFVVNCRHVLQGAASAKANFTVNTIILLSVFL